MSNHIPKVVEKLKQQGILLESDHTDQFRDDLHYTKLWADSFWRRGNRHSVRKDPEIQFLKDTNPTSVLEIGSAYGRFAKQALGVLGEEVSYTGIEVCHHFQPYLQRYFNTVPSNLTLRYDNFFEITEFDNKFDSIVLPMNTLPSFPNQSLGLLLQQIKKFLKPGGYFIFSSYIIPSKISEKDLVTRFSRPRSGELLVEDADRIAMEYVPLERSLTDFGASEQFILLFHRLDKMYSIQERAIFWNQHQFLTQQYLEDLLTSHGFSVEERDDKSHSLVYVALKPTS